MLWILIPVASFLWRVRGGLLNDLTGKANWLGFNDTAVRLLYAEGLALAYWWVTGCIWWEASTLAVALFLGCTVVGWFNAKLYPVVWRDVAWLSLSGTLRMAFVAAAILSPWPLLVGLLCGPIYFVGGKLPQRPGGCDFWQEWLFGAAIGASLVGSVLFPVVQLIAR